MARHGLEVTRLGICDSALIARQLCVSESVSECVRAAHGQLGAVWRQVPRQVARRSGKPWRQVKSYGKWSVKLTNHIQIFTIHAYDVYKWRYGSMSRRPSSAAIRQFILEHVQQHPGDLVAVTAETFGSASQR